MADENGHTADLVSAVLEEDPSQLDFFQIVRRLECIRSDLPRVGTACLPREDSVCFRQNVSLAFAPSTIAASERGKEGAVSLAVNCFGLLGPNGPLPLHLTEYVSHRMRHEGDRTLDAFLNVFNHRMISLLYRAWACCQMTVSFDRPKDDPFLFYIETLLGLGGDAFQGRDALLDVVKAYYSGRLACPTRNAEGLQAILEDYFEVPVAIDEFVGQWIELPPDSRCVFGASPDSASLGRTVFVGERTTDYQQKFRLRFGPMRFLTYERFFPDGEGLKRVVAWVRNYLGFEFAWDIQLVLMAREVPPLCVGRSGLLGRSTWLLTREFERDADDLIVQGLCA